MIRFIMIIFSKSLIIQIKLKIILMPLLKELENHVGVWLLLNLETEKLQLIEYHFCNIFLCLSSGYLF
jgi:hypothetical protein